MTQMRRMLTAQDVAEAFGYTAGALYVQRVRGQEPGSLGFKAGKRVLFDPADIEAYIAEQKAQRHTADDAE